MTADPPHVPRSPLKLPKLDGTSFLATPTQRPPNGDHKSAIERVAKTKTSNENPPPSAGKGQKVTAVAPPRRSLSLPASRPVDERVATRDPSPVRRGSLLRRRSGDFSLPVRYKVRNGGGNADVQYHEMCGFGLLARLHFVRITFYGYVRIVYVFISVSKHPLYLSPRWFVPGV